MKAIIVANGDVTDRGAEPTEFDELLGADDDGPPYVIAADGGARKARALDLSLNLVVGDGDSLGETDLADLRARGIEVRLSPAEKDESDTELALRAALARGADRIVMLGALGGLRFDHALANVALLTLPELDGREVVLADGATVLRVVGRIGGPGELRISGEEGDLVSLFPLDPIVEAIVTDGLLYPLRHEALRVGPSRGLSNELVGSEAHVATGRGRLLVVHTRGDRAKGAIDRGGTDRDAD